ncbi:MAG: HPr family phosphocarrier protein [Anaerolineales bacterium]
MIDERLILLNLNANTAETVIRALGARMEATGYVKPSWADAVLAREKVYATGLPTEVPVGLPHTDVEYCLQPAIAVATLVQPVTWGMMGDPTQTVSVQSVFALSVVQPQEQVKTLTNLIDFCQKPENLRDLHAVPSRERAAELLRERLGAPPLSRWEKGMGGEGASITLTVTHAVGLHARPAAKFVQTAARFQAKIEIANLARGNASVNAKSVLKVLTLAVQQGQQIRLQADGPDAEAALAALRELVESDFGE